jgi:hypothetical protein
MNSKKTNTVTCEQCRHAGEAIRVTSKGNRKIDTDKLYCNNRHLPYESHPKDYSCGFGTMTITNANQQKTLKKIFDKPTPNDISWAKIESLITHIGCTIKYGKGSRVKFAKGAAFVNAHRPHPQNQTPIWVIEEIKIFLAKIGVTP